MTGRPENPLAGLFCMPKTAIDNQSPLSRLALLAGEEALARLADARILVCGLGGVGSWAAEALARSGVGHLVLADCDTVAPSNINRQAFALHSTVGQMKCHVAATRLKDIAPKTDITYFEQRLTPQNITSLLKEYCPTAVLDAIDDRPAKLYLIESCVREGIPLVSSMGAANRTHPEAVRVMDLFATRGCPMAQVLRKALRKRGITGGVPCVFSTEAPIEPQAEAAPESNGAKRPMGTLVTVTAVFGMLAANALLEPLLNTDTLPRRGDAPRE